MANGRFITTEIAESRVWRFGDDAALLWMAMIPHLDRDGRIMGEPAVLRGKVCSQSALLTVERVEQLLFLFAEHMDFEYYEDKDGKRICQLNGFSTHQHGLKLGTTLYQREGGSRYAAPDEGFPIEAERVRSIASVRAVVQHEEAPF